MVQTGTPYTGVCGWYGLSLALDIPDARVLMTDVQAMAETHNDERTYSACAIALRHMEGTASSLGLDGYMTGDCVTYAAEAYGVGVLTVRDHEQWYMASPTGGFHVTSLEEVKKIARPGSFQVILGHDGGEANPKGTHWDVWLPASTPELPAADMEVLGPHLPPDKWKCLLKSRRDTLAETKRLQSTSKVQSTSRRWGVGDSNVVSLDDDDDMEGVLSDAAGGGDICGDKEQSIREENDDNDVEGVLSDTAGGGDVGGDEEQSIRVEEDDGMEDTNKRFDNVATPEPDNQIPYTLAAAITAAQLRQREWTDTNLGWTLVKPVTCEPNTGSPTLVAQLPASKVSCDKQSHKRKQPSKAPKTAPKKLAPKNTQQTEKSWPKKKVTSDRNKRTALNVKLKRQALTIEEKKEYNRKKNEKLRMYRAKAKKKKEEKKKEDR